MIARRRLATKEPVVRGCSPAPHKTTQHAARNNSDLTDLPGEDVGESDGGGSAGSSAALLKATQKNAVNDLNLTELPGEDDGGDDSASEA